MSNLMFLAPNGEALPFSAITKVRLKDRGFDGSVLVVGCLSAHNVLDEFEVKRFGRGDKEEAEKALRILAFEINHAANATAESVGGVPVLEKEFGMMGFNTWRLMLKRREEDEKRKAEEEERSKSGLSERFTTLSGVEWWIELEGGRWLWTAQTADTRIPDEANHGWRAPNRVAMIELLNAVTNQFTKRL